MKKKQKTYKTWKKGTSYEEKLQTGSYFKRTFKTQFANNTRSFVSFLGKILNSGQYLPPASATRDKIKEKIKISNFIAVMQILYKMNDTQTEEFLMHYSKRNTAYGVKRITDKCYLKSFCSQYFNYKLGEIPKNLESAKRNKVDSKMREYLEEALDNAKDPLVRKTIKIHLKS